MGHIREQDRPLHLRIPERPHDRPPAVREHDAGAEGRVRLGVRESPPPHPPGGAVDTAPEFVLPREHTHRTLGDAESQPAHDGIAPQGEHTHDDGEFSLIAVWKYLYAVYTIAGSDGWGRGFSFSPSPRLE